MSNIENPSIQFLPLYPRNQGTSLFASYFKVQEGIISTPTKTVTIYSAWVVVLCLVVFFLRACYLGDVECSETHLPMISDILALPHYEKIFAAVATSWFILTINPNVRAFYYRLDGRISRSYNNFLLILGYISSFNLIMVGILDTNNFPVPHVVVAVIFFFGSGIYYLLVTMALRDHRQEFNEETQKLIDKAWGQIKLILTLVVILACLVYTLEPDQLVIPIFEWTIGFIFILFMTTMSSAIPFYETIHQHGTFN